MSTAYRHIKIPTTGEKITVRDGKLHVPEQPIVGYVLDVVGLRIGVAIFAVAWSVINMAHGLAGSWRGLAFLRGLMGFEPERSDETAIPGAHQRQHSDDAALQIAAADAR